MQSVKRKKSQEISLTEVIIITAAAAGGGMKCWEIPLLYKYKLWPTYERKFYAIINWREFDKTPWNFNSSVFYQKT